MANTRDVIRYRLRRSLRDLADEKWQDDEVNDAINEAINEAWPSWFDPQVDTTTVTIATNTFSYALPTGCERLCQVWLEQDSGLPYVRVWNWRVARDVSVAGAVTRTLYLDRSNEYTTGKVLRLVYEAKCPELSDDTTETTVPFGFLIPKARSILLQTVMHSGPAYSTDFYNKQMAWNQQIAEDFRQRNAMQPLSMHVNYDPETFVMDQYAAPYISGRIRLE